MRYVYVTKYGKHHKIGKSKNPEKRAKDFATVVMPDEFEVVHTMQTRKAGKLERGLHKKYAHRRVSGEWFSLSDFDVYYIKRHAGYFVFAAEATGEFAEHHAESLESRPPSALVYFLRLATSEAWSFIAGPYWAWRVNRDMRS